MWMGVWWWGVHLDGSKCWLCLFVGKVGMNVIAALSLSLLLSIYLSVYLSV